MISSQKNSAPSLADSQVKTRYEFLDFLRGLMMISVIFYHFMYDLVDIMGMDIPWFGTTGAWYWQQITAGTFIFLSGVCCNFSRNNTKRGVRLFMWGVLITVVTLCIDLADEMFHGIFIYFGILTCLGCCGILLGFFKDKLWDKIHPAVGAPVSILLYLFTRGIYMCGKGVKLTGVYRGFLGIERLPLIWLPHKLYTYVGLEPFGLPTESFSSSDYFPIIPFFFLFMFGYFSWKLIKNTKFINKIAHFRFKPINFVGEKSIWFYLLHQPIIALVLGAVMLFSGKLF